jgi:three-Cys-motif partner protein
LSIADPFDAYVFCEKDETKLQALKERARRVAPGRKIDYVPGDCNAVVETILTQLPRFSSDQKVLSLCLVDPFDIGIKFSTIKKLSTRFVDFLVLLAVYMDANRAYVHYLKPENKKVDDFLGQPGWRDSWEQEKHTSKFPDFLARQYAKQMTGLGYLEQDLYKMKRVRSDEKNLPLYRMALFSRNRRAYDFWDEVLKYSTDPQLF